jgi:hypothetical protein
MAVPVAPGPGSLVFPVPRVRHCGAATLTGRRDGHGRCGRPGWRACTSMICAHREHLRRLYRRRHQGFDGPDGPRQRARGNDLPAPGTRGREGDHERHRRSRRSRAGQRHAAMTARPGHLARSANGTLMACGPFAGCAGGLSEVSSTPLTWDYTLERAKDNGAGEGNRTLMASLEGWGSAIELRPHPPGQQRGASPHRPGQSRVAYRLPRPDTSRDGDCDDVQGRGGTGQSRS